MPSSVTLSSSGHAPSAFRGMGCVAPRSPTESPLLKYRKRCFATKGDIGYTPYNPKKHESYGNESLRSYAQKKAPANESPQIVNILHFR